MLHDTFLVILRGAIGGKTGKTGKTAVLPGLCKIECGGGSGGAPLCIEVLSGLGACAAPVAPLILVNKFIVE